MSSSTASKSEVAEGRLRLRKILPEVKAELAEQREKGGTLRMETLSGIAKATAPYIREENFDSLVVYQNKDGFWHADLILKKTPVGVSTTMGTPVAAPLRTKEAALHAGRIILQSMLLCAEQDAARAAESPKPPIVFSFYGIEIELDEEVLRVMDAVSGKPTYDEAFTVLSHTTKGLFPAGFTTEKFKALSPLMFKSFILQLHLAAICGVFRFPSLPEGTPSGHPGEPDAVRH